MLLVVGHGVGITLALRVLLYPTREGFWETGELLCALASMFVVWAVAFGVGPYFAQGSRARQAAEREPVFPARRERLIAVSGTWHSSCS